MKDPIWSNILLSSTRKKKINIEKFEKLIMCKD